MEETVKKLLEEYDDIIARMENFHRANIAFVPSANANPEHPAVRERMGLARYNKMQLEHLKAQRQYIADTYLNS